MTFNVGDAVRFTRQYRYFAGGEWVDLRNYVGVVKNVGPESCSVAFEIGGACYQAPEFNPFIRATDEPPPNC